MAQKQVVVYRGIVGAGKTTHLNLFFPNAFRCSASDFFTNALGVYKYYLKGKEESNKFCQHVFGGALRNGLPMIAVDNTHIKNWEFETYLELAEDFGYSTRVIRIAADPDIAYERNIHGVPKEHVQRMYDNMQDLSFPGVMEEIIEDISFSHLLQIACLTNQVSQL